MLNFNRNVSKISRTLHFQTGCSPNLLIAFSEHYSCTRSAIATRGCRNVDSVTAHSSVLLLFLRFSRSPLLPSPEIVHQSSDVGPKHPTDIAVGPIADGGNDQDEEREEDADTEP